MAILTDEAKNAAKEINVTPNVVLKIDGYAKKFSNVSIKRYIKIGDPGLKIGPDWKIGGYTLLENQSNYLMFNHGASTRLSQTSQPDRGQGSGVARMVCVLLDKDNEISKLVSPGQELSDILARGCEVELGFENVRYPDSYVPVIRGYFEGIKCGAGYVILAINQVEDEKNRAFVSKQSRTIQTTMTPSTPSSISVPDSTPFKLSVSGPAGVDTSLSFYARIGDEIIGYTTNSSNTLGGLTRGLFGTVATDHDIDDEIYPVYRLQGLSMDLALKMMLSGVQGPYASNIPIDDFGRYELTADPEVIFFKALDLERDYNVVPGTYFTTSGAGIGGNNVSNLQVSEVVKTLNGSYLRVEGHTFSLELNSPAVIQFRSQYDSWGEFGLGLSQKDVDIVEHEELRDSFLGSDDLDFLLESIDNVKTFLDLEIYKRGASFSVPKFGRASVHFHRPPIAGEDIAEIDKTNVQDPDQIQIQRSLSTNFFNAVEFRYDYDLVANKFKTFKTYYSTASAARIDTNWKPLIIESKGMKTSLGAETIASAMANRLLSRYQYGAEYLQGVKLLYGVGYPLEIGQVCLLDTEDLNVTNFDTGDRSGKRTLVEVLNKSLDVPNAEITADLINTSFGLGQRFASFSPSSFVAAGSTTTNLRIKKSFGTKTYETEGRKWESFVGLKVLVHNEDFSVYGEGTIQSVYSAENSSITLTSPLGFTPAEDYEIDLVNYKPTASDQEKAKLKHVYISPNPLVVAGISQTQFTVSAPDAALFQAGFPITIHNEDYSIYSAEVTVTDVTGTTITVSANLGFVPSAGLICDLLGFPDGGECYRFI